MPEGSVPATSRLAGVPEPPVGTPRECLNDEAIELSLITFLTPEASQKVAGGRIPARRERPPERGRAKQRASQGWREYRCHRSPRRETPWPVVTRRPGPGEAPLSQSRTAPPGSPSGHAVTLHLRRPARSAPSSARALTRAPLAENEPVPFSSPSLFSPIILTPFQPRGRWLPVDRRESACRTLGIYCSHFL